MHVWADMSAWVRNAGRRLTGPIKPSEIWPGGSRHYRMLRTYPSSANPSQLYIHIKHPDGSFEWDIPLWMVGRLSLLAYYDTIDKQWVVLT